MEHFLAAEGTKENRALPFGAEQIDAQIGFRNIDQTVRAQLDSFVPAMFALSVALSSTPLAR
jgi:hypothetical protein